MDTVSYFDASLYADLISGKGFTGEMHFLNKTLMDWYCKRQAVPNTSTFGAELDAARSCTQHITDLRLTLRYMGVPLWRSVMFGDSKSVVDNTTVPRSRCTKRHTALGYHSVREAIARNIFSFHHIPGDYNPADMLTKHWGYNQIKMSLKALLFWPGDTNDLIEDEENDSQYAE